MKAGIILIFIIIVSYGVGQWLSQKDQPVNNARIFKSSCDPAKTACNIKHAGFEYSVELIKASSLTPFDVVVKMNNSHADAIDITFDMDGMDMGYSRYPLIKEKSNWKVRVILPVCSFGRSDWILSVKIKTKHKISVAKFNFSPASQ